MDRELKNRIHLYSTELADRTEILKRMSADENLVELLRRASILGSTSILNFNELGEAELMSVLHVLALANDIVKDEHLDSMETNYRTLESLVDSLEALFRSKKLLLDSEKKKIA